MHYTPGNVVEFDALYFVPREAFVWLLCENCVVSKATPEPPSRAGRRFRYKLLYLFENLWNPKRDENSSICGNI